MEGSKVYNLSPRDIKEMITKEITICFLFN